MYIYLFTCLLVYLLTCTRPPFPPMSPISPFTIFPAIDLRQGKVVRLAQGDPDRQTTYGDDPRFWAERWKAAGAEWLHVINLSGAFDEDSRANLQALENILQVGLDV